ncbi:MAG: hypothetical protein Aurels2KO_17180 [Aureliella sp.]
MSISAMMGQKRSSTIDTTLLESQGYSIPPGGMPSPVKMDASKGPRVIMELRSDEGRHLESIPLPTDRGVFIEDLIQQAELHKELGNVSVSIMRPNGSGAPPLRLETRTDKKGKAASIGENYALLPGDHVIVYGDQRTLLERFIDDQMN